MSRLEFIFLQNLRVKEIALTLIALTATAQAMADNQYTDTARVLSVTPQTERINFPRQECHTEYQQQSYGGRDHSVTGAVIGGIAGGLLGNTVGRGNGRVAAAAVGAGLGAVVGNNLGSRNNGMNIRSAPVQSCYQADNWQTVNTGYLVTYEYDGRVYSTVTNNPPGEYIDVNISISPNNHVASQVNYIAPQTQGNMNWNHRSHHDNNYLHRNSGHYYNRRYY